MNQSQAENRSAIWGAFISALFALALTSCGGDEDKDPIVGNWGNEEVTFEFREDGKAVVTVVSESLTIEWKRIDEGKIQLTTPPDSAMEDATITAEIEGDKLTVKAPGETPFVLTRNHSGPTVDAALEAKITAAKMTVTTMETQLKIYENRQDMLPTTEQGLKALVEKPTTAPIPRRWTQLLMEDGLIDPWGNPFQYRYPGEKAEKFDVWSLGPDGKDGTSDDIGNW